MPEAIGAGVPLFTAPYDGTLDLLATETYSNGAVRLVYRTSDREVDRPAI
jgi:hypothetical protein